MLSQRKALLSLPLGILIFGAAFLGTLLSLGVCNAPALLVMAPSPVATVASVHEPVATRSSTVASTQTQVPVSPTPIKTVAASPAATVYTDLAVLPSPPPGSIAMPPPTPTRAPDIARLQIPAIRVDTKVIEVGWHMVKVNGVEQAVWDNASFAAGHLMNTRNPGEGGNIVISGHNNIEGMVFANLWKLKVGDEVILTTAAGTIFKYRISQAQIVNQKYASPEQQAANARFLDPTPSERVTLISCYPPTNNTNRVIVIAEPEH